MPNFIDKTIWGGNGEVSVKEAGLPNITGSYAHSTVVTFNQSSGGEGSLTWTISTGNESPAHGDTNFSRCNINLDASKSSPIYGNSTTVQPPAITLVPQIRFSRDSADTGSIITFVGTKIPNGYLSCDGSIYDIDLYKDLADFILDQFGSYNHFGGDGITTFGVPNINSSSPVINCIKF